jgi:hypothetical protein
LPTRRSASARLSTTSSYEWIDDCVSGGSLTLEKSFRLIAPSKNRELKAMTAISVLEAARLSR